MECACARGGEGKDDSTRARQRTGASSNVPGARSGASGRGDHVAAKACRAWFGVGILSSMLSRVREASLAGLEEEVRSRVGFGMSVPIMAGMVEFLIISSLLAGLQCIG